MYRPAFAAMTTGDQHWRSSVVGCVCQQIGTCSEGSIESTQRIIERQIHGRAMVFMGPGLSTNPIQMPLPKIQSRDTVDPELACYTWPWPR